MESNVVPAGKSTLSQLPSSQSWSIPQKIVIGSLAVNPDAVRVTVFWVALLFGSSTRFPTPSEAANVAFGTTPKDIDFPLISFPVESIASINIGIEFGAAYSSTTNFALTVTDSPRPKVIGAEVRITYPLPSLISRYEFTPSGKPNISTVTTPGVFPLNAFREIDKTSESPITCPCNAGGIFCGETSRENVLALEIISNGASAHFLASQIWIL